MFELEYRASEALKELLARVPIITVVGLDVEKHDAVDILVHIGVDGHRHVLACAVKSSGQPRHVRTAILQLRDYAARKGKGAVPLLIAPYLSSEAQAMCREDGMGFLDLEGNAWLAFDGVFIERLVANKPPVERRELKSIFKPKSAQVLRVLLRDPRRAWRVTELAEAAAVSLGHVSNVRTALLDREWAQADHHGLSLTAPDALLDSWRDAYEAPAGRRLGFYTTLHGAAFENAVRQALAAANEHGHAVLASFSAAQWMAPYARTGSYYFYADEAGLDALRHGLKLSAATKGENVIVTLPKDPGLFRDAVEPAPSLFCTSPVQTYLDLAITGERGREAADHLRQERLTWLR
ncbi:type IV toxin-antitoxin system AbiEi family antitoxin [Azospirillum sp. sgz302134]